MSLSERITNDLQKALRQSDKRTLSVLRMAKAALINREKEEGKELSEHDVIEVLSTLAKQRRESIEQFSHGGREDLAEKERQELDIVLQYLPEQLSTQELDTVIAEAIHETSADGLKDLGKVMKILMPRIKGVADGKIVNQRVKDLLASP
jgi:uncharacterized protein YqeY